MLYLSLESYAKDSRGSVRVLIYLTTKITKKALSSLGSSDLFVNFVVIIFLFFIKKY